MTSRRLGLAAGLVLSLAAGCAASGSGAPRTTRPPESPTAHALPEADPGQFGMVQGTRMLTETEQVAVRLGRAADGRVVILQILSPGMTQQQQEALRRAFDAGEWRREAPLAPDTESWIENLVRARR
jgi:hypothetical protein